MPDPSPRGTSTALPAGTLLAAAGGGSDPEALGALAGRPMVVVRVDDDLALHQLTGLLRRAPCVSVGVASAAWLKASATVPVPELDLLLTDAADPPAPWVGCRLEETLARIHEIVAGAPAAAVALVQLLRLSAALDLLDGLVAESLVYSMLQAGSAHRRWLEGRRRRPRHPGPGPAVRMSRGGPDGSVLRLELDRPELRNAFNTEMRDELVTAFDLASLDPTIRGVEVRGRGPSFCSGGDLDEFGTAPEPPEAHLIRASRSAARSLWACAERTSFFVHGASVGAGIELAALSGEVVADPGATFLLPELTMGLVPGAGGTATIPRRIGRQRTAYLAVTAEAVDASTAHSWGLVDRVEPVSAAEEPEGG